MDFEITVGDTTYNLNDDAPFRFVSFTDVSSAEIVRLGRRSPTQDSTFDLGYRLAPRTMQLELRFYASTAAILDTYRDQLAAIFKPTTSYTLQLRVERDDGVARTLNCHAVGEIEIALDPSEYAAKMHRATVTLRAANPAFKAASSTTATLSGVAVSSEWWLAGGAIGTAVVVEHVEYPTQGQAWAFSGTVTSNWTVVFRSEPEEKVTGHAAFRHGTASNYYDPKFRYMTNSWGMHDADTAMTEMSSNERTYFVWNNSTSGDRILLVDADTTLLSLSAMSDVDLVAAQGAWRGDRTGSTAAFWTEELPRAAIYSTTLDSTQRNALNTSMAGILGTISAVNSGDLPVYPYITFRGPIANPILTNVTTGGTLNLYGYTIGSADAFYVDLTSGNKTIVSSSGSVDLSSMLTPAQLAGWYLAPSPIATGGTNTIRVQGGSTSTATRVEILYHNYYMSY
jgi:hypothetical protein